MDHNTIGMPPGARLMRLERKHDGWIAWLSTNDFVLGTYLYLYNTGRVERITVRADEGDEIMLVRPSDDEIRSL